jgi:hypothetical protein
VRCRGALAGTWRQRISGRQLTIPVESTAPLTEAERSELNREAEAVASLRGLRLADLVGLGP